MRLAPLFFIAFAWSLNVVKTHLSSSNHTVVLVEGLIHPHIIHDAVAKAKATGQKVSPNSDFKTVIHHVVGNKKQTPTATVNTRTRNTEKATSRNFNSNQVDVEQALELLRKSYKKMKSRKNAKLTVQNNAIDAGLTSKRSIPAPGVKIPAKGPEVQPHNKSIGANEIVNQKNFLLDKTKSSLRPKKLEVKPQNDSISKISVRTNTTKKTNKKELLHLMKPGALESIIEPLFPKEELVQRPNQNETKPKESINKNTTSKHQKKLTDFMKLNDIENIFKTLLDIEKPKVEQSRNGTTSNDTKPVSSVKPVISSVIAKKNDSQLESSPTTVDPSEELIIKYVKHAEEIAKHHPENETKNVHVIKVPETWYWRLRKTLKKHKPPSVEKPSRWSALPPLPLLPPNIVDCATPEPPSTTTPKPTISTTSTMKPKPTSAATSKPTTTSRPTTTPKPATTSKPTTTLKPVTITSKPTPATRPTTAPKPATTTRPTTTLKPVTATSKPTPATRPTTTPKPVTTSRPTTTLKPVTTTSKPTPATRPTTTPKPATTSRPTTTLKPVTTTSKPTPTSRPTITPKPVTTTREPTPTTKLTTTTKNPPTITTTTEAPVATTPTTTITIPTTTVAPNVTTTTVPSSSVTSTTLLPPVVPPSVTGSIEIIIEILTNKLILHALKLVNVDPDYIMEILIQYYQGNITDEYAIAIIWDQIMKVVKCYGIKEDFMMLTRLKGVYPPYIGHI